jgi:hypothetical protein
MPFDSAGNEVEEQPGPAGARMAQLGILTRAQKKKPILPNIRMNAEGKPNAGDQANANMAQSLAEKAEERKQQMLQGAGANTVPEADPMKTSLVKRMAPGRPK